MKAKFAPEVYAAMEQAGFNNRETAEHLGVSEAAVRRGLKSPATMDARVRRRYLITVEEA